MTGFDTTFDPQPPAKKTSGLAITSLIFSLIVCCPVATIIGPLLGLGALVQIGRNPALKGRGLAFAAIIMGVVFTLAQGWGGYQMWQVMKPVLEGPNAALTAGFAGDTAALKAEFHGAGATASDAEVTAFIGELRKRYGAYQSCRHDQTAAGPTGAYGDPVIPFPYILTFDNGEVHAEAEYVFAEQGIGWIKKWGSITVFDPDLGDLTYPPSGDDGNGPDKTDDADTDDEAESQPGDDPADPDGQADSDPDPGDGD